MLQGAISFTSFSVDDIDKAREFYTGLLGLELAGEHMGNLEIKLNPGGSFMIYPKDPGHTAASFTVLNFMVEDLDAAVAGLKDKGVEFLQYDGFNQDENLIARTEDPELGPDIAWFCDPAGNIIAVMQKV